MRHAKNADDGPQSRFECNSPALTRETDNNRVLLASLPQKNLVLEAQLYYVFIEIINVTSFFCVSPIQAKLFIPHQAAKEFLKNRLSVTAAQADEYTKAARTITELASTLQNKKKHPFLPETDLPGFKTQVEHLVDLLSQQRETLLNRLTKDEILDFIQQLADDRTGTSFSDLALVELAADGEKRYAAEIPPGYKDTKKDAAGDPYRKFGDLIVWKQLIEKAKSEKKSLIFVTDDKKDDWWIEQSGRTIGPRTELREEFIAEVSKDFWMYTVDLFIEEAAKASNKLVSATVLEEIRTVREEVQAARLSDDNRYTYQAITPEQMLKRIKETGGDRG